jgi:hypothetical protein
MPFKVGAKSLPLADCECSSQLPAPAAAAPCGVKEYRPHVGAALDALLLRAEQAAAVGSTRSVGMRGARSATYGMQQASSPYWG